MNKKRERRGYAVPTVSDVQDFTEKEAKYQRINLTDVPSDVWVLRQPDPWKVYQAEKAGKPIKPPEGGYTIPIEKMHDVQLANTIKLLVRQGKGWIGNNPTLTINYVLVPRIPQWLNLLREARRRGFQMVEPQWVEHAEAMAVKLKLLEGVPNANVTD